MLKDIIRHRALLLMLLPGVVFFIVFSYIPMTGTIIAFKDYRIDQGVFQSSYVGIDNFKRLFLGADFMNALQNTVFISFLRLFFGFFAPIILAILLNEVRISWYKRTIQTLTYMPFFFSWVILGGVFLMVFNRPGPINYFLVIMGFDPISFLSTPGWFIFVLIITGIWQTVGYGAVIYLAALSGIDPTLYEAAVVDGAGKLRQITHITIPCLMPTIITLLILSLGGVLNAGFDQIYNMYNPMVYEASDIIDTYVMRRLMNMDYSLATAAGLFKSVVGLMLIVGANSLAKKMSKGEQGVW